MTRPALFLKSIVFIAILCIARQPAEAATVPENLFNIGDSIGEGEAVNDAIGSHHHDAVWSTGYNQNDIVYSFNERFAGSCPAWFEQNQSKLDHIFNQAVTGADMYDFAGQAAKVISSAASTQAKKAGMITIFLGSNDACSSSIGSMTSAADFERYFRDGLDLLATSPATRESVIHVSSIPSIYWLWESLHNDDWCKIAWNFVPCANMLADPVNDCASSQSTIDPDNIYPGDGPHCIRRKQVHAIIKNRYNPILKNVVSEYVAQKKLPNAYYSDIFSIRFQAHHVNHGDCFHPSYAGHELLAQMQWNRTPWANSNVTCPGQKATLPWLLLLLNSFD